MHRKIFYFLMIFALSSTLLLAQKGKIKGKVTDLQTGDVLIGVSVSIVGTTYGAQTGADGDYLIQNLDPGNYNVKVSYIGYKTMTYTGIRVNSDQTAYENFKLPSDDITVNTVEVVAERRLIQKGETSSNTIKTAEDIQSLPTRNINTVINLSAGVSAVTGIGTSIRGGRTMQTGYYLEGVQNTNPLNRERTTDIAFDAMEEVSVQSGGMSAEYGNANSGVIRQNLKSGSSQFRASIEYLTDNVTFMSLNDIYANKKALGQYPRAYNETSLNLSGPLFINDLKFFTNLNHFSERSPNDDNSQYPTRPYDFGNQWYETTEPNVRDTVPLNWGAGQARRKYMDQRITSTSTLNYDIGDFKFRFTGILGLRWSNTSAQGRLNVNTDRGNDYKNYTQAYTARLTHILSNSMFYEINVGYSAGHEVNRDVLLGEQWELYGDPAAQAAAGAVWTKTAKDTLSQYAGVVGTYGGVRPTTIWGDAYWLGRDAMTTRFWTTNNSSFSVSGALNLNIGKEHSIKIGGDYRKSLRRVWDPSGLSNQNLSTQINWVASMATFAAQPAQAGLNAAELKAKLLRRNYVGGYGYTPDGEIADDNFDGPFNPTIASAYFTDKIEYEDLIIDLGLRYDYIDPNTMKLIDPLNPQTGIIQTSGSPHAIDPTGWEKVTPSSTISPRINVVFPISEKTRFRATYGNYVQMDQLNRMYTRPMRFVVELASGFNQTYNALNMRPTRTTTYEVGLDQEITDFLAIQMTAYYRDIKDELTNKTMVVGPACQWPDYTTWENGDFATTKGIELNLNMRRYKRLLLNGSFSFTDARGTGSNPNSNFGVNTAPLEGNIYTPQYIAPLNYNIPIKAGLNIDYRFGLDEGGPIFSGLGFSLLVQFQNGHPYTRGVGSWASLGNSAGGGDARFRIASEPLNTSYTPNITTADLRIDKQFRIFDRLQGTVYLTVNNVFDIINVYNVYTKSGSAADDSYLSDPTEVDQQRRLFGETWYAWRKERLEYGNVNTFYSNPRTFVLGFRLDY